MAKHNGVKYRHRGGVLAFPREVKRSAAYRHLSLAARCLMIELQDVWKPGEAHVHYSVRRAVEALGVSATTASRAFLDLAEHGFVEVVGESNWITGQARTYRLTWLSANGREPSNEWLSWSEKIESTFHQSNGRGKKRFARVTVEAKQAKTIKSRNQQTRT